MYRSGARTRLGQAWELAVAMALAAAVALATYLFFSPADDLTAWLGESDPEDKARAVVCGDPFNPSSFEVHAVREWRERTMVVFTASCPRRSGLLAEPALGFVLLQRGTFGWDHQLIETELDSGGRQRDRLVEYTKGVNVRNPLAWVIGRVRRPEAVGAVEVLFDNGEVERDTSADPRFVLVSAESRGACELRALSPNGDVLERYDLSGDPSITSPDELDPSGRGWTGTFVDVSLASAETCAAAGR